jgi:hypothetical protein
MTQAYNLSQLANNLNTTGQLDATDGLVNAVPAANGGTGQSVYTVGDILYASTTTALAKLSDVATGNVLISGGAGVAPSYGKVGLTSHVSGTLPSANGGTNSTATPTAGGVVYGSGSAMLVTAAGTAGQVLVSAAAGAPTWGAVQAAQTNAQVFSTVGTGQTFTIPAGVTRVKVTLVGGGGTGATGGTTGGGSSIDYYGAGGGGGGTAIKWLAVSGGGAGGTLTVAVGGAGGSSTIASGTSNTITTVTASGGSGVTPGTGTNGDLNITGGNGTSSSSSLGTAASLGGGTFMAGMSNGTGKLYGGGGGGGYGSGGAGSSGAQGVVIIEY